MKYQPIILKNVRVHNLKNISLTLTPNQLIVITGVSGSGKSSLAFDTIYAEGQRRYIESLSTYARRQLGSLPAPDADHIEGLSPTIAIQQKTTNHNPRSTVGTMTGVYDYLRVLFARTGTPYCPISHEAVIPQSLSTIINTISTSYPKDAQLIILSPFITNKKGSLKGSFEELLRKGFIRIRLDGTIIHLEESIKNIDHNIAHTIEIVTDRIILKKTSPARLMEAITQALELSSGTVSILNLQDNTETLFSQHAYSPISKQSYPPLEPMDFSFNHPRGMCEACEGIGVIEDFDLEKIIDPSKSIAEDCCLIAGSYNTVKWQNIYNNIAQLYKCDVHTPWEDLSNSAKKQFLYGNKKKWTKMTFVHPQTQAVWTEYIKWRGVISEAKKRYNQATSASYKSKMQALMHHTTCGTCNGSRLKPYPSATQIGTHTIYQLTTMSISSLSSYLTSLKLSQSQSLIAYDLILEINKRLEFLIDVGLHYLSLSRTAPTLSGGESQRVRLASQIGCGLIGTTYILDEPSIGLHARDNTKLIHTLKKLKNRGNTVIVVEHDQEMMKAADTIIDIGPGAGRRGGSITAMGTYNNLLQNTQSLTSQYLNKTQCFPASRQRPNNGTALSLSGATHHNLKNVNLTIPLNCFVAIAGVSGSGKSSLITHTLYPALTNHLSKSPSSTLTKNYDTIQGLEHIDKVIAINQHPIGRTPRSNPSTYIKVFDDIRALFAQLPDSQIAGFKVGRFSFNVLEGSCSECKGMGQIRIDLDFIEDAWTQCPLCKGHRFDPGTLSIKYKGKTIHDVLLMSVDEATEFFINIPQIHKKLHVLQQVGIGYISLGQSSHTLSGGEAQRIKIAKELLRPATGKTIYLLDEPTTGLHAHDIHQLINILQSLVDANNTVIIIEHHIDCIKTTDWVIELGPEGGHEGGYMIAQGSPHNLSQGSTPTGIALAAKASHTTTFITNSTKPPTHIYTKGCRQHNLQNISPSIPRHQITICTGPSGSGKSSFAFDTVYAEGQRRYIASLPAYARQFVKQMAKPRVDDIDNLSPAIAIEQKRHAGNPRSTIGTITEIYDFLRILYAHIGTAYCPETGEIIESITKESVTNTLMKLPKNTRLHILVPITVEHGQSIEDIKKIYIKEGFLRIRLNGNYYTFDDTDIPLLNHEKPSLFLVVDRLIIKPKIEKRLFEAIEHAYSLSLPAPFVVATEDKDYVFNLAFGVAKTGKTYPSITPHSFSFNASEGMCPDCLGLGTQSGANLTSNQKIMQLTPYELLDNLWKDHNTQQARHLFLQFLDHENIDPDQSLYTLPSDQLQKILNGSQSLIPIKNGMSAQFMGINHALSTVTKVGKKDHAHTFQHLLEPFLCLSCQGSRLNPLSSSVRVETLSISQLCTSSLSDTLAFIQKLPADSYLDDIIAPIIHRLSFLCSLGLDYLSLSRSAPTLSGGEMQRIHLARQLGTGLTGCLYVLDEPTIGLHPHNNERLNQALKNLCKLGNTLLMVEHDPLTLKIADHILDFGPGSGSLGGEITASGSLSQIQKNPRSLTGQYISKKRSIPVPKIRRATRKFLTIKNATTHNLNIEHLQIPLNVLTCVSGVSGSGKSTLISKILRNAIHKHLASRSKSDTITTAEHTSIEGVKPLRSLISIDQSPIGTTSRADISTYSNLNRLIRQFFAQLPEASVRGLQPKHFSHNHAKGMCRQCLGLGFKNIHLQFLPPVRVTCDTCKGLRLNPLSLSITYKGFSMGQLLQLPIDHALEHLPPIPKVQGILQILITVGLGYLPLGHAIQNLSGGEAGRLRLARELAKRTKGHTLYIFDEPSVGLHSDDIAKLIPIFQSIVDQGHSIIIIEHNIDILNASDYIIDLGPGAGIHGGSLVAHGSPEEVKANKHSLTAQYLL